MRAVLCKAWGTPENLVVEEVAPPPMVEGGVRIAVKAAGINFADTLAIQGKYQVKAPLPFSPGLEGAGEVIEAAPGVTRLKPGDRVVFNDEYGAWAEQVVLPAKQTWIIPAGMDWRTAGGFPVVYTTSHTGLADRAGLKAGDWLMVHGAAGGVGLTAVEIGKKIGATVIATASTDDKLALARAHGADYGIKAGAEDVRARVKEITKGRGCDVIYDPVGGDLFDASLRCLAWNGRIIVIGFASGRIPQAPANILLVKHASVMGHYLGSYRTNALPALDASYRQLFAWYEEGALHPHVSHTFPMAQAGAALQALLSRKSTGKVVLDMTA